MAARAGRFRADPGGEFPDGGQLNPLVGKFDELPVHAVSVSAFYMAKYEVTKALWDEVRTWGRTNGYTDLTQPGARQAPNHPVHP